MRDEASRPAGHVLGEVRGPDPGGRAADPGFGAHDGVDLPHDRPLHVHPLENALLDVEGAIEGVSEACCDDDAGVDRGRIRHQARFAEVAQALTYQRMGPFGSTWRRIEQGDFEACPGEDDGPTTAHQTRPDDGNAAVRVHCCHDFPHFVMWMSDGLCPTQFRTRMPAWPPRPRKPANAPRPTSPRRHSRQRTLMAANLEKPF